MNRYLNKHEMPGSYTAHTVRVTLQYHEYKGCFAYEVGGNCLGLAILRTFEADELGGMIEIDELISNDIQLWYDENEDLYFAELKNDQGNKVKIEASGDDLEDMVVAIEIISAEATDE